jgi:hypothetical protein
VVPITQTFQRDDRRSSDDGPADSEAEDEDGSETAPILCWVCRRPIAPTRCIRWRGEPVHPECR